MLVWYEGAGVADRRWLVADERGSVVAVTDAAGNATRINSYDAYGIPGSTNGGRFGYTGQVAIPELGLYDYKARIYSPSLGRFLQTDPAGYPDGPNWYAYAGNDPINNRDPSGLGSCRLAGCADGIEVSNSGFGSFSGGGGSLIDSGYFSAAQAALANFSAHINSIMSAQIAGGRQSGRQGREVPCSSLGAFNDAVRDSSFADTLARAAVGDATRKAEHSFVYGPLFNLGSDIFSSHPPSRGSDFANTAGTFLVPSPRISFHTHRDASRTLSTADATSAVNNGYPTAIFDIDRREFRCVAEK